MRAFVITIDGHDYSQAVAERCIRTGAEIGGVSVEKFRATDEREALCVMHGFGLRWAWGPGCKVTGLRHHAYGGRPEPRIGCAMSHYRLWRLCSELDEPILILEHDAVFIRELPEIMFMGLCQINDPAGATRRGAWWSSRMQSRGAGVHAKTCATDDPMIPDGLAGNSAYLIKPHAARELMATYHELGVWPNDATMCRQLFPDLEELFPFVTRVEQTLSTTST